VCLRGHEAIEFHPDLELSDLNILELPAAGRIRHRSLQDLVGLSKLDRHARDRASGRVNDGAA
jgi:hypothetical protein